MVQREQLEERKILQQRILTILHTQRCKKVEELVEALREVDKSPSIEEISEAVELLEDDDKVTLLEPPVRGPFISYLTKNYSANLPFWFGLAVISFSLFTTYIFTDMEPIQRIRIVAGAITLFFLPGYGLGNMIFPNKEIPLIERAGLSFVLSLAIVPVLWLALDNSPLGTGVDTIVFCMSAIAAVLISCGTYRRFCAKKDQVSL